MRVNPLLWLFFRSDIVRIVIVLLLFAVNVPSAFAQQVPDVMNALGVPYSPAVEHALEESDRKQLYGDEGEQPKIPLWEYLTTPHPINASPEEPSQKQVRPYDDIKGPVGEIDESLIDSNYQAKPGGASSLSAEASAPLQGQTVAPVDAKSNPSPGYSSSFLESPELNTPLENPSLPNGLRAKTVQTKPTSKTIHIGGYNPAEKKVLPVAVIDINGKQVLPLSAYSHICSFSNGFACVSAVTETDSEQKTAYGYLNEQGEWVIPPIYALAGDFKHSYNTPNSALYARAQWPDANGQLKWGYIDTKGQMVIPNRFDWAGDFSEGLAIVTLPVNDKGTGESIGQQYGYINSLGTVIIQPQFEEAEPFQNALAKVWDGKLNAHGWPQYAFITFEGTKAIECQFDWVSSFQNGYARVGNLGDANDKNTVSTTPEKFGYMDTKGQLVIPVQFDMAWPFVNVTNNQQIALVKKNGQYGYILPTGVFAFTKHFDWADEFHENLAAINIGGRYGFINPKGEIVIKPQFDWVGAFSDGLAPVAKKTPEGFRYGFINRTGKITIPLKYSWVLPFSGHLAQVR